MFAVMFVVLRRYFHSARWITVMDFKLTSSLLVIFLLVHGDRFLLRSSSTPSVVTTTGPPYVQKCCDRKKQLNENFETCIPYEGLRPFEKYDANVTRWLEASVNVVKMEDEDRRIWWMPPGTRIYSPSGDRAKLSDLSLPPSKLIIYKENVTNLTFRYGNGALPCKPSDQEIVPFADNVYLLDNGALLTTTRIPDNVRPNTQILPSSAYCLDRVALINPSDDNSAYVRDHTFVILSCPCLHTPCIRMCCHPRHYLKQSKPASCELNPNLPFQWNLTYVDYGGVRIPAGVSFPVVHAIQDCEHGYYYLNNNSSDKLMNFSILPNADIQVDDSLFDVIQFGEYCIHYTNINGTFRNNLLICLSSKVVSDLTFKDAVYGSLFVIGSCFLAVTLLIYAAVPELRNSLHSKILMAHTRSLLLAYVTLSTVTLYPYYLPVYACVGFAYILQFSFVAAFFWLNVMCVDITWTFSGYKVSNSYITQDRDRKFLFMYSLYSWGFSLMVSFITAFAEYSDVFSDKYKPNFGVESCWFQDSLTVGVYFYFPIGVTIFVNTLLFSYTTSRILKMQKDSIEVSRGDNVKHVGKTAKSTRDKNRLILYAKLFGLMGVTWIFDILSWALGGRIYCWYITDAINALRGVFIFYMTCWKPRVLLLVCNRLPTMWKEKLINYFRLREEAFNSVETSNRNKQDSNSTQSTNLPMNRLSAT